MNDIVISNDILLIDDDAQALKVLQRLLQSEHYSVRSAETAKEALAKVKSDLPAIVLLDLGLPDASGVDLLEKLLAEGVGHVIVVSGNNSAEVTRQCLRSGAFDFILKPASRDDLLQAIRRASSSYQVRQVKSQKYPIELEPGFGALATRSQASKEMFILLKQISSRHTANALITGPAGLFKRDIAALLHHYSQRPGPALLVNCALEIDANSSARFTDSADSIDDETQTGYLDQASQGTLVLDDLSLLPIDVQDVLVQHIKQQTAKASKDTETPTQKYHCNVVGILKEPVEDALSTGRLQSSLHTALASNLINVPALEERSEDVEFFARHAVSQLNTLLNSEKSLSQGFVEFLTAEPWRGNLIELKNRLLTVYRGTEDGEEMIYDPLLWPSDSQEDTNHPSHLSGISPLVGMTLSEAESRLIMATLASVDDNKSKAANVLGISVKTLYNRLKNPG